MTFERILVPTDFSDCSREAIDVAVTLAQKFGGKITLLHSVETPDVTINYELVMDFMEKLRETSEKELADESDRVPKEVLAGTALGEGEPVREVLRVAKETNASMIVVGTHGRKGLAHFLLGSTTERLIRHSPVPIMVVPHADKAKQ